MKLVRSRLVRAEDAEVFMFRRITSARKCASTSVGGAYICARDFTSTA